LACAAATSSGTLCVAAMIHSPLVSTPLKLQGWK
jgi:hypothetical protein